MVDLFELCPQIGLRVFFQMVNDAGVRATEIGLEPDVDARDRQFAVFDPGTTGAVDELPGPLVEQFVGVFGSKRLGLQVRTANGTQLTP